MNAITIIGIILIYEIAKNIAMWLFRYWIDNLKEKKSFQKFGQQIKKLLMDIGMSGYQK